VADPRRGPFSLPQLFGYVAFFFDPGALLFLSRFPFTSPVHLDKYGADALKERFLPMLLRREGTACLLLQ
jgi:hypothetical protein